MRVGVCLFVCLFMGVCVCMYVCTGLAKIYMDTCVCVCARVTGSLSEVKFTRLS